ncbi:MAG: response regulator [Anaerolineales bacterium]|jgi:CheY-like chemotaxis protein
MTSKSPLTLLVSNTESLQNGLLALFTTLPNIGAVLVAEDYKMALRMIKSHLPALVILDMSLPEMHDLIVQVKADWAHIHLIALVEDTVQQKAIESFGVERVLRKGFSPQKLMTMIEDVVEEWGSSLKDQTTL